MRHVMSNGFKKPKMKEEKKKFFFFFGRKYVNQILHRSFIQRKPIFLLFFLMNMILNFILVK